MDLRRRCSRGMKKISYAADIGSRPRSYIGETAAMQNVSRRPQDMSRPSTDDAVRSNPGLLVELRGFKPQCSWRWLPCNRRHSRTARMDFGALPPQRRRDICPKPFPVPTPGSGQAAMAISLNRLRSPEAPLYARGWNHGSYDSGGLFVAPRARWDRSAE